ncbi:MAG: type VI secretion system protein TssA [Gammaproteobacteria bacterium]
MAKKLSQIATEIANCKIKQTKALKEVEGRNAAFADIKAETDKVGSITGEEPDWPLVEKAAAAYLRKAERDFRVAVFLARAWSVNHGADGAIAGLILLHTLLQRGVDDLLPARVTGRRQAIEWWSKHALLDWQNRLFELATSAQLAAFVEKLAALSATITADSALVGKPKLVKALTDGLTNYESSTASIIEEPTTTAPQAVVPCEVDAEETGSSSEPDAELREQVGSSETANQESDVTTLDDEPADKEDTQESETEPDEETLTLIERLLSPVGNDNPAGEEHYLSDEFEHIQREVNAGWRVKTTDWEELYVSCDRFLRTMSKDLRVMVYTLYALLERQGLKGFTQGLHVLDEFVTRFAADCYPARSAGRRAALSWLAKTASEWFRRRPDETFDLVTLNQLRGLLERIDLRLMESEELNVNQPVLGKALSTVRTQVERSEANLPPEPVVTKAAVRPKPAVQKASAKSVSATPAAAPATGDMESEADFRSAINSGKSYWLDLARFRRQSDPSSPLSYRLLRYWAWGSLGNQVKVDSLQPPADPERKAWETAESAGDGLRIIELAETALLKHRFCLDLNRITCDALEQMGYTAASHAVKDELRQFLDRLPDLSGANFRGEVPTADGATLSWIEQLHNESESTSENVSSAPGASSESMALGQETMASARALLKEGNTSAAVAQLEQPLRLARSGRERFYWQQLLGRLFLESGAIEMALVMLETLDAHIENYRLEEWDHDLVIGLAPLVQQVDAKVSKNGPLRSRIHVIVEKTRARVTRVDPAGAIEKFNR